MAHQADLALETDDDLIDSVFELFPNATPDGDPIAEDPIYYIEDEWGNLHMLHTLRNGVGRWIWLQGPENLKSDLSQPATRDMIVFHVDYRTSERPNIRLTGRKGYPEIDEGTELITLKMILTNGTLVDAPV